MLLASTLIDRDSWQVFTDMRLSKFQQCFSFPLVAGLISACGGGGGGSSNLVSCNTFPEQNVQGSSCTAWYSEQIVANVGQLESDINSPKIDINENGDIFGFYRVQNDAGMLEGTYSLSFDESRNAWNIISDFGSDVISSNVAAFIDASTWLKATVIDTGAGANRYRFVLEEGAFNSADVELLSSAYANPIVQMTSFEVDYATGVAPAYAFVLDPTTDYRICVAYKPTLAAAYQVECSSSAPSNITDDATNQVINKIDFIAKFDDNSDMLSGAIVYEEAIRYQSIRDLTRINGFSFTADNTGLLTENFKVLAEDSTGSDQFGNPLVELAEGTSEYFISFEETQAEQAGLMILEQNLDRLYPVSADVSTGLIAGGANFDTARNSALIKAEDGDMVWAIFATKDTNERPVIFRFNYTGGDQAGYALSTLGTVQAFLASSDGYNQNGLDMDFDGNGNMVIAYKESLCADEDNVAIGSCSTYSSNVRVAYYSRSGFIQSPNNVIAAQSFRNESSPITIVTDNEPLDLAVNDAGQTALIFQERRTPENGSGSAENTVRVMRLE